jgi:hypothetical protein
MLSRMDAPPAHMATRRGQDDRKIIKITRAARAKVRLVPRTLNLRGDAAMFPLYFPEKNPQPDVVKVTASGRAGALADFLVLK